MPLYRVRIHRDNMHPATEHYVTSAETPRGAVMRVKAHITAERKLPDEEYAKYYRLDSVTEMPDVAYMLEVPR